MSLATVLLSFTHNSPDGFESKIAHLPYEISNFTYFTHFMGCQLAPSSKVTVLGVIFIQRKMESTFYAQLIFHSAMLCRENCTKSFA